MTRYSRTGLTVHNDDKHSKKTNTHLFFWFEQFKLFDVKIFFCTSEIRDGAFAAHTPPTFHVDVELVGDARDSPYDLFSRA